MLAPRPRILGILGQPRPFFLRRARPRSPQTALQFIRQTLKRSPMPAGHFQPPPSICAAYRRPLPPPDSDYRIPGRVPFCSPRRNAVIIPAPRLLGLFRPPDGQIQNRGQSRAVVSSGAVPGPCSSITRRLSSTSRCPAYAGRPARLTQPDLHQVSTAPRGHGRSSSRHYEPEEDQLRQDPADLLFGRRTIPDPS